VPPGVGRAAVRAIGAAGVVPEGPPIPPRRMARRSRIPVIGYSRAALAAFAFLSLASWRVSARRLLGGSLMKCRPLLTRSDMLGFAVGRLISVVRAAYATRGDSGCGSVLAALCYLAGRLRCGGSILDVARSPQRESRFPWKTQQAVPLPNQGGFSNSFPRPPQAPAALFKPAYRKCHRDLARVAPSS
jgi:hypothetical protein